MNKSQEETNKIQRKSAETNRKVFSRTKLWIVFCVLSVPFIGVSTFQVWKAQTAPQQISLQRATLLKGHQGPVRSVVFSPDGRIIATGGIDGKAQLWDRSGRFLTQLKEPKSSSDFGPARSVIFSPDGKTIATTGPWDAQLWDRSGRFLTQLKESKGSSDVGPVRILVFSPDGKTIATSRWDTTVQLWNLSGKELAKLQGHKGMIDNIVYSPDSKIIAITGWDGTVLFWNLSKR